MVGLHRVETVARWRVLRLPVRNRLQVHSEPPLKLCLLVVHSERLPELGRRELRLAVRNGLPRHSETRPKVLQLLVNSDRLPQLAHGELLLAAAFPPYLPSRSLLAVALRHPKCVEVS